MARASSTSRHLPGDPLGGLRRPLSEPFADPLFAEALFDWIPDIVFFIKDTAGRYAVVNQTLVERCGLSSKAAVIGRTATDLFPGPLGQGFALQDRRVLTRAIEIRHRLELHHYPDHTQGWCLTYKIPLRGVSGAIIGMAGISRDLDRPDERRSDYRAVAQALEHLEAHFAEPLRIDLLARIAGLHTERFQRLVRKIFGLTPTQLLTKTRIDTATRLLLTTNQPIVEIALACGYSDHSAFTRKFRAHVGLAPTTYRAARLST